MNETQAPSTSDHSQSGAPTVGVDAKAAPPSGLTRRRFLRTAMGLTGLATLTTGYGVWEASQIRVRRSVLSLGRLPASFEGKSIALLADFHHGPFTSIGFIREAVRLTQSLSADIVALVGDYANHLRDGASQLPPCLEALERLEAPLGVFAVPGNHDMLQKGQVYRDAIAGTRLTNLSNRAERLQVGGESLWIAGVDDLWWGVPDLNGAVHEVPDGAAVILLSHNPDFAEDNPDARVDLVLSGHTHGGQIHVPGLTGAWIPSQYGSKYRSGLVQGPASQVFITCGVGTAYLPLRLNCPPEINLLTLVRRK